MATAITPAQACREMGRGLSLGQRFEASQHCCKPETVRPLLLAIKERGLGHVRIPVCWYPGDGSVCRLDDPEFMTCLDAAIEYALALGLYVMVNAHHERWLCDHFDGSDAMRGKWYSLWRNIATRYKEYSTKLFFHVLNEPKSAMGTFGQKPLPSDARAIELTRIANEVGYHAIRSVSQNRLISISPNGMSSSLQLPQVYPTRDALPGRGSTGCLIMSFHCYSPWSLCGEDGSEGDYNISQLRSDVDKRVASINKWHASVGGDEACGINLGEFGIGRRTNHVSRNTDLVREFYRYWTRSALAQGWSATPWCDSASSSNTWFFVMKFSNGKAEWPYGLMDAVFGN
jgi:hypothetical protein